MGGTYISAIEFGAGNSLVLIRELEVWQSVSLLPERSGRSLYYRGKTVIGHDPAQLFAGDISVWVIGVIKWTCRVREKVSPSGSYFASELIYPQAARGLATDIHLPASRQRTGDRHFGHGPNQALELDLGEVA
jgi:hypothetical protein